MFILFMILYIFLAVTAAYLLWRQVMQSPRLEEAALAAAGR
jgi:cytochrome bd-type quinol oxidase subunit 1